MINQAPVYQVPLFPNIKKEVVGGGRWSRRSRVFPFSLSLFLFVCFLFSGPPPSRPPSHILSYSCSVWVFINDSFRSQGLLTPSLPSLFRSNPFPVLSSPSPSDLEVVSTVEHKLRTKLPGCPDCLPTHPGLISTRSSTPTRHSYWLFSLTNLCFLPDV